MGLWHKPFFFLHAQALQKGAPLPDTTPPTANNVNTAKLCGSNSHISPRLSDGSQGGGQCAPVKSNWSEKCDFYLDIVRWRRCQHNQSDPIQPQFFPPLSLFEISRLRRRPAADWSNSVLHTALLSRHNIRFIPCKQTFTFFFLFLFFYGFQKIQKTLPGVQPSYGACLVSALLWRDWGGERGAAGGVKPI